MNPYFHLFSCCIPVKGYKKAVICDLQRNIIQPIPIPLYEILTEEGDSEIRTLEDIASKYGERDKQLIEEYITFLYHNQFGYTSKEPIKLLHIDFDGFEKDEGISNAIVDFDNQSVHTLGMIIPQLSELSCEALEVRCYFPVPYSLLINQLQPLKGSTIQSLEVLVENEAGYNLENILKIKEQYPVLKKMTVSNVHKNIVYNHEGLSIIYTSEKIRDERCCGVTNEFYCIAETKLFIESVHYNSCLNQKISVDRHGFIKNCPSMSDDFGSIFSTSLKEALEKEGFKKVWNINKDQIEVCSDCELRYVCQDCRAYIEDDNNIYSKPVKCNYNPYA
jgi:SPASM domain peptide maturase of grasp-with-spasm system